MRTTITLDEDVAAAAQRIRREEGVGISEAINRLARAGLAQPAKRRRYEHRSAQLGIKVDISNIGAVLDLLDES
jgi:Arc/MetJ family transcription regulator